MKKTFLTGLIICCAFATRAQDVITPVEYIQLYKDLAIREMKRMGVPAAITLAQGILETESGNSDLVKKSNNHFGIKCKSSWTAATVTHDDDAKGECFRSYPTAEDSYRDHSNFLRGNERYGFLFNLDVKDYQGWAYGLKKAGYATNPKYPQILIKHIEQYNLQQYTLEGAGDAPLFNAAQYQADKDEAPAAEKPAVAEDAAAQSMLDVSDKVIMVNGSKCVFAGKGTSLLVVATKNDIPLAKLLSFNELSEDGMLTKSQHVFLEKKSKTGDKDFYIARGGESLYDIAQANGIQMEPMLSYNKLWGNEDIRTGTKIFLKPGLWQPAPKTNEPVLPVSSKKLIHIVQAKEGLYAISKKYNVTVQQLKEWNKLESEALSVGQELVVSQ
jgi:LysM repeat protein